MNKYQQLRRADERFKGLWEPTIGLILAVEEILAEENPMTLRQIHYELVARQFYENTDNQYKRLSDKLGTARLRGIIPWEWIEDRTRVPRSVPMWADVRSFAEIVPGSYNREVWETQDVYLELWLEKDALSGYFMDLSREFGITLNIGRGYDGWTSIHNAALRFQEMTGRPQFLLHFADFDPSGKDMTRDLETRLVECGAFPIVKRCALTRADIDTYNLPPDFTKVTDSRAEKFIEEYGDIAVELDALPKSVLRARIRAEIESLMDLDALALVRQAETEERALLRAKLGDLD